MTGLIIVASALVAQNRFALVFGGTGAEEIRSLAQTQDGGFVLMGYTRSFGALNPLLVKISPTGSVSWARYIGIGTPDPLTYGGACGAIQTSDGGYFLTGQTTLGNGWEDAFFVKLDQNGALEWAKACGGPGLDGAGFPLQLADGSYIVAGSIWDDDWGYGNWDAAVFKLDQSGDIQWARVFGSSDHDNFWSIDFTSDGGYVFGGYTRVFGTNPWNGFAAKLGYDGTIEWVKAYDAGTTVDGIIGIVQTPDGGYGILVDRSSGNQKVIVKTNAFGVPVWARQISATVPIAGGGNIVSEDGDLIATFPVTSNSNDMIVLRLNNAGSFLWAKRIGGTGYDVSRGLVRTSDGGFALCGETESYTSSRDLFLLKAGSDQTYEGCLLDWTPTITNITVPGEDAATGKSFIPNVVPITPSIIPVTLSSTNICLPMNSSEGGHSPGRDRITCSAIPGGLAFFSDHESELDLYLPDGRLAMSGILKIGRTRIPLEPGVYLWQAGPYKGKAVVR